MKLSDYFYYDTLLPQKQNYQEQYLVKRLDLGHVKLLSGPAPKENNGIAVWELHFGPIPEGKVIDHIDRDKSNNRIENLRCVSQSENMTNQPQRNKSGYKCVYQNQANGKYQVRSLKDRKYY